MRRIGFFLAIAGIAAWLAASAALACAQTEPPPPGMSSFLVARPEMPDPLFAETVILMLPQAGAGGEFPLVVGLIVNKPLRTVTLRKLFPESPALRQRSDLAFFGGPVDIETPAIVYRADKPAGKAIRLPGGVCVNLDPDQAAAMAQDPKQVRDFRLILGRSQWAPDQLHSEIMEGSWYTVNAEASIVFAADPAGLWNTMAARARLIPAAKHLPELAPGLRPAWWALSDEAWR